jgi:hypothetical protein
VTGVAIDPIVGANQALDRAFWMNAANQAVRSECGWHVAPVITETLVLDGSGTRNLLLPSGRVTQIIKVTNAGEDVTSRVKHSRAGMISFGGYWSSDFGDVEVELTHGYAIDEVADVAGVIAALIGRAMSAPAGITSQTIGPASVRHAIGKDGANLSIPLLLSEKETLAPYKLQLGA